MDGRRKRAKRDHRRPPPSPLSFTADHISALPDHLITRIFSFLPFKDVVKTSALSTRWRYAWTTATPHVAFDGAPYLDPLHFQSHVNGVLSQFDSVPSQFARRAVKKFHVINLQYNRFSLPNLKLDGWLKFAEKHHVEDLRLGLIASSARYTYKQLLFRLSGLVRLEVSACRFSLDGATRISWPLLKVLSMEDVELSDDILGRILRGSPVLESPKLARCQGVKNIVIDSSTSVKDLLLISGSFSELEKIWAPDLLSLCISGTWYPPKGRRGISLDDISSLVEAKLDFVIPTGGPGAKRMCCDLLKELLEKLRGVPTITIGGWCLQVQAYTF